MTKRIGVHLRVTGHTSQGGRKYMEDCFSVAYQHTEDQSDLEYAYFGIFDGHGGSEAAFFAKNHLMDYIVSEQGFWSENDDDVLQAIREGFLKTHKQMWLIQDEWPKTASGLPSTAGTTASIAFVRHGKIYTGHVGDSGIILGYQEEENSPWLAVALTEDHKPESATEKARIENNGGKVVIKSGVPRVVWKKPRVGEGHKGPVRRNTPVDEIPFLAVARSLGDLWSFNPDNNVFVVSPEPDVAVKRIDVNKFRCLLFGTDGLWNMLSPQQAVTLVQQAEANNKLVHMNLKRKEDWINPSKRLVEEALLRWSDRIMRADNTTVVSLMLDPPGVPKKFMSNKIMPLLSQNSNFLELNSSKNTSTANVNNIVIQKETESLKESCTETPIDQFDEDRNIENTNQISTQDNKENGRYSTVYENIDDVDVLEENKKAGYAEVQNINDANVTCIDDDEEMSESYDTFLMDFNAEHIKNVIFGQLPDNYVCPKPTVNHEKDINLNKLSKSLELDDETKENYSQPQTNHQTEDKLDPDLPMNELNNCISPGNLKEDEFEIKDSTETSIDEISKSKSSQIGVESESIQIHEISSSVSQDTIEDKCEMLSINQRSKLRKNTCKIEYQHKKKSSSATPKKIVKKNNLKKQVKCIENNSSNKTEVNIFVQKIFDKKYWFPIVRLENYNLETLSLKKNILKEKKNVGKANQKNKITVKKSPRKEHITSYRTKLKLKQKKIHIKRKSSTRTKCK